MKPSTVDAIVAAGLDPTDVARVIRTALAEDLGPEGLDLTSVATVPVDQFDTGDLVARADGVLAGIAVAGAVFELVDERATATPVVADGARVRRGDVLATITGPTRALLTAERTALNLLCRMSGVATHTRAWADELAGTKTGAGLPGCARWRSTRCAPAAAATSGWALRRRHIRTTTRAAGGVAPAAGVSRLPTHPAGGITSGQAAAAVSRRHVLLSPHPGCCAGGGGGGDRGGPR